MNLINKMENLFKKKKTNQIRITDVLTDEELKDFIDFYQKILNELTFKLNDDTKILFSLMSLSLNLMAQALRVGKKRDLINDDDIEGIIKDHEKQLRKAIDERIHK